jgi:hypothetical protein
MVLLPSGSCSGHKKHAAFPAPRAPPGRQLTGDRVRCACCRAGSAHGTAGGTRYRRPATHRQQACRPPYCGPYRARHNNTVQSIVEEVQRSRGAVSATPTDAATVGVRGHHRSSDLARQNRDQSRRSGAAADRRPTVFGMPVLGVPAVALAMVIVTPLSRGQTGRPGDLLLAAGWAVLTAAALVVTLSYGHR